VLRHSSAQQMRRHCKDRFLYRRAARRSPSSTPGPHPPLPTPPPRRGAVPCAPRSCHAHPSQCIRRTHHFTVPRTARHQASRGPTDTACGIRMAGSAARGVGVGLRADLRADKSERMRPLRPRPLRKGEANASGERVPLRRTWLLDVVRAGDRDWGFQSARQRRTRDKPQNRQSHRPRNCALPAASTRLASGPTAFARKLASGIQAPLESEAIVATCRTRRRRRA